MIPVTFIDDIVNAIISVSHEMLTMDRSSQRRAVAVTGARIFTTGSQAVSIQSIASEHSSRPDVTRIDHVAGLVTEQLTGISRDAMSGGMPPKLYP
jgi:hypothetical protein